MSTSHAQLRAFPQYEAPTSRFPRTADGKLRTSAGSSGKRLKLAPPSCEQLERMSSFVSLYTNLKRELDSVLDPQKVLVLTGYIPVELDADDPDILHMLRLVNGVSCVADVIESSGMDRTHAVSVLCTLVVARTITFV
jgi:hypothetical protein